MLRSNHLELSSLLENYSEAIVLSSYENWPPSYQQNAFANPLCSLPISVRLLKRALQNEPISNEEANAWIAPARQREISATYFPKLGPVSWKEIPPFRAITDEELPHTLPMLLASMTGRMRLILKSFVNLSTPTFLHLFPFRDMSNFVEVRLTISKGNIINARLQRAPTKFVPDERWRSDVIDLAWEFVENSSLDVFYLDICLDSLRPEIALHVLEINPIIPVFKGAN